MKKPKSKTLIILSILVLTGIIISFKTYKYLNVCVMEGRSKVSYIAEKLMDSPESANTIIPYEMLSDEYKEGVSKEEYTNADEPLELLELYSKPIFQIHDNRIVDVPLSTTGYKKQPEGYYKVGEQWYYITHEIDIKPDFITLDLKVVRWYIEISEIEPPLYEQVS